MAIRSSLQCWKISTSTKFAIEICSSQASPAATSRGSPPRYGWRRSGVLPVTPAHGHDAPIRDRALLGDGMRLLVPSCRMGQGEAKWRKESASEGTLRGGAGLVVAGHSLAPAVAAPRSCPYRMGRRGILAAFTGTCDSWAAIHLRSRPKCMALLCREGLEDLQMTGSPRPGPRPRSSSSHRLG